MTTGLDIDLSVQIGNLAKATHDQANELRRRREIERARVPQNLRLQGSAVCPTPTANFGIGFGGPDPGFFWVLRGVRLGGLTWSTSATGSGELYVTGLAGLQGVIHSGAGSVAAVRSLSDLEDAFATLPGKNFYSSEQIVVNANESVVAVVVGGTAGQQYSANLRIQVVRTVTSEFEFEV